MADISVKEEAQKFASDIEKFFADRKVILDEGARGLLLLAAEEWVARPPRVPSNLPSPRAITPIILEKVVHEQHIANYGRRGARVPFFIFLYALGKAGRDVLEDVVDKGL